ncbi:MAG: MBL fold metallo-hydrolase [Thermoguttaceae bacterium]
MSEEFDDRPYDDQVYHSITAGDITVQGYSRAAMQTYWRIPEMKLGFDLGAQPWAFMGTPRWFLSHTHLDHALALPAYVARRRMMKMEPPVIYLPEENVDSVHNFLTAASRLDRGRLPCELVGVKAGDSCVLSRELVVTVIPTFHTLPSVGYIVWERRKKLKPEFLHLSRDEIRDVAVSGVEVSHETRQPRVAYLGDTSIRALDISPELYTTNVLILEVTFVSSKHRGASIHKYGHIHLDDLIARRERFQNDRVIASHFSTRIHDDEVVRTVHRKLPDMLNGKLILWI